MVKDCQSFRTCDGKREVGEKSEIIKILPKKCMGLMKLQMFQAAVSGRNFLIKFIVAGAASYKLSL